MRIANTEGAVALNHDGVDYEVDESGMFDVPQEVGEALIGFPHWMREHEALEQADAQDAVTGQDPQVLAAQVAALQAQLAELTDALAAATKPAEPVPAIETPADAASVVDLTKVAEPAPAKPRKAPAKKAAPKPAE